MRHRCHPSTWMMVKRRCCVKCVTWSGVSWKTTRIIKIQCEWWERHFRCQRLIKWIFGKAYKIFILCYVRTLGLSARGMTITIFFLFICYLANIIRARHYTRAEKHTHRDFRRIYNNKPSSYNGRFYAFIPIVDRREFFLLFILTVLLLSKKYIESNSIECSIQFMFNLTFLSMNKHNFIKLIMRTKCSSRKRSNWILEKMGEKSLKANTIWCSSGTLWRWTRCQNLLLRAQCFLALSCLDLIFFHLFLCFLHLIFHFL